MCGCASRCSLSSCRRLLPFRRAVRRILLPRHRQYAMPAATISWLRTMPSTSTCSSWGSSSANDCCGTHGGYCGGGGHRPTPTQWISVGSCTGLDFIRVTPGCGVEVATAANGGGTRYTYNSSPFVCGRTCESRPTPGCDSVRSIRLYPVVYPPPSPPSPPSPPAPPAPPPNPPLAPSACNAAGWAGCTCEDLGWLSGASLHHWPHGCCILLKP